jgi:hypothetical protein
MLSRQLINEAFSNPRLRAEMLALAKQLETTTATADTANATATSAQSAADQANSAQVQPLSDLLTAIAALPADQTGMIAVVGTDQVAVYPLVNFMRFLGKGPSTSRPSGSPGIYFDTTLAAGGKPIFTTGTGYVDSTGAAV